MASEKAKVIASKVRGQSVYVYAATSKDSILTANNAYKDLNAKETSSFSCSDCGNHMHVVASASPEPYCISCGSDNMVASTQKVAATASFVSDKEIASVSCPTCETHNVLPASAVAAAGKEVHCVMCGTQITVADAVEDEEFELDKETSADGMPDDGMPVDAEDDFPDMTAESAIDGIDDEISEEFTSEETYENPEMDDIMKSDGMESEDTPENLFIDDQGPAAPGEPLMDSMDLDDTPESLSLMSVAAGTVIAMKGIHTVAYANAKTAGKNADILERPEFEKALMISAGTIGMRKALAQMGFSPVKVKPVDAAVVSREVVQAKSQFMADQSKKQQVFTDSMALAAVGLSRNLWKGAENPLRTAIEAKFADLGVRNPKAVTSKLLSENGLAYSKTIVAVATKLAAMSGTARKEYAEMLDLVEDDPSTANADEMLNIDEVAGDEEIDDVADDIDNVTARFQTPALLLPKKQTAGVTQRTASAVLAGTAPLNFNF